MLSQKFTTVFTFLIAFCIITLSSCQKDPEVLASAKPQTDSLSAASGGNILASAGTLTIRFRDSTYTFDAAKDSIAFVEVKTGSKENYFGITAINKAHNLSFGISSPGAALGNNKTDVAGSQLLFKAAEKTSFFQYSLFRPDSSKANSHLNIIQYKNGKVLAKGTFMVLLSVDTMLPPGVYKAEGSFDLRMN